MSSSLAIGDRCDVEQIEDGEVLNGRLLLRQEQHNNQQSSEWGNWRRCACSFVSGLSHLLPAEVSLRPAPPRLIVPFLLFCVCVCVCACVCLRVRRCCCICVLLDNVLYSTGRDLVDQRLAYRRKKRGPNFLPILQLQPLFRRCYCSDQS